jgi:hypothetical protein
MPVAVCGARRAVLARLPHLGDGLGYDQSRQGVLQDRA